MAQDYGFESISAQEFIKKGSDHHYAWSFMEKVLYAVVDELLQSYIDTCEKPTVDGYWNWCKLQMESIKLSKNYVYLQQMVMKYLMAIALFRLSVRRNHFQGIIFICMQLRCHLMKNEMLQRISK